MKFDKSFLKSKTLWAAVITIVAGFLPDVQAIMKAHPEESMAIIGTIFGSLRLVSDKKLVVKEDKELL